ncbi:FKBP-like peptidyl-prolyl cis-trans isomerase family protein isoform X2 [Carex rostrata]
MELSLCNNPSIVPLNSIVSNKRKAISSRCHCSNISSLDKKKLGLVFDEVSVPATNGRRWFMGFLIATGLATSNKAEAASTSRRALKASKIPESEFKTLPSGLKYYDIKVGGGAKAVKGSRVAIHYVAKWKGITFMTSRQGLGVGGGTPYGFDVGQSERGNVLKGLDLGVEGMKVGGQRILIVPPELAYGSRGVQEIPPNATIELDVELLSIKQTPFGTPVKIVEG